MTIVEPFRWMGNRGPIFLILNAAWIVPIRWWRGVKGGRLIDTLDCVYFPSSSIMRINGFILQVKGTGMIGLEGVINGEALYETPSYHIYMDHNLWFFSSNTIVGLPTWITRRIESRLKSINFYYRINCHPPVVDVGGVNNDLLNGSDAG